jgi:hypothetical protein
MGPYNTKTNKLLVSPKEFANIHRLRTDPDKLFALIKKIRKAYDIPPNFELGLEVDNESVL